MKGIVKEYDSREEKKEMEMEPLYRLFNATIDYDFNSRKKY